MAGAQCCDPRTAGTSESDAVMLPPSIAWLINEPLLN